MRKTGLLDRNGEEITEGDRVSLAENMTADDSMGDLPNGYIFDVDDVYRVYFDSRINNWSLELGVEPDTRENRHYMSHAVSLLHSGDTTIVRTH